MRRILRKILAGEEDQLGDTSTVSPPIFDYCLCKTNQDTKLSDPSVVEVIIETVHRDQKK